MTKIKYLNQTLLVIFLINFPQTILQASEFTSVRISEAMELRTYQSQVLEKLVMLPVGTLLQLYPETANYKYDYRDDEGNVQRSSTGFLFPMRILSVPSESFSQAQIDRLNLTQTGLYISSLIERDIQGTQGKFTPLALEAAGSGFLTRFHDGGKPKTAYTKAINQRFPKKVNQGISPENLTPANREKFLRIYQELLKVGNRTVETSKDLLMIPINEARHHSLAYENAGSVHPLGGWSVAVEATAVRHGFANVPCAEFMSEVVRQAYQRAGYNIHQDFNKEKGNQLIWTATASVVGLSASLVIAGWTPWDPQIFRPPTGALLFHMSGKSPGHTYLSAGQDGQFIVDNGAPQGRNLRTTVENTLSLMYQTGLFILPPGVIPARW